jgi:4-methylaminobutanoate oxidase (formaldehyde-forming)
VRPLRRSPLYERLKVKRAVFGSKLAWERANYFLPEGASEPAPTFGTPGWLAWVLDEQRAAREGVVVFDQTSFSKLVVKGRDALAVLQRLCANDVDVPIGRMVYTAMLNRRGGFESDLTITRIAADTFFVVTGSAQATRDADWIQRHVGDAFAVLADVTSAWSVLSVMGPKSRELLARVSPADLSPHALPFSTTAEIDVGYARVRAARMSYIGGPGFELYVPTDQAATAYDALFEAGVDLGLRDAGYYALDALRIEAGRRAWGAELGPDETPWEAGLGFAVRMDKGCDFIGRDALLALAAKPSGKRLLHLAFDDPAAFPWGGEPILIDGRAAGELTSAGYSAKLGRAVGLGYVHADSSLDEDALLRARFEVDIAGTTFCASLVPVTR